MFLGRGSRERLEPVGEVGGPVIQGPVLHRHGHRFGHPGVELPTLLERLEQRLVGGLRETGLHLPEREDVLAEDLVQLDAVPHAVPGGGRVLDGAEGVETGSGDAHVRRGSRLGRTNVERSRSWTSSSTDYTLI